MRIRFFITAGLCATLIACFGCGTESNGAPNRKRTGATLSSADTVPLPGDAARSEREFPLDELLGKFDPALHPDFVPVGRPYAERPGMRLRREAHEAFRKMWEAAHRDGITLTIISSTRTFAQQKIIWDRKWERLAADWPDPQDRARKILEYSAMPGASRHHWGTDIDLNDLNNPSFEPGGVYVNVYAWLQKNAHRFGFCQPYTPKGADRPHGYNEEKWHWSYQPLATRMLRQYAEQVQNNRITGFQGSETAAEIGIVQHYALGVHAACTQ